MSIKTNSIILFILCVVELRGQPTNIKFDQIGLDQGLSQSTVTAIIQDSKGFMWFGTQDGLNRYDGYSILVFKNEVDDSFSISDNNIWCLMNDRNGNLWVGTMRGGLNKYVSDENRFYRYNYNVNDTLSISENYVTAIFEDSNGDIWVGTRNSGLNRFNKSDDSFTRFVFNKEDSSSISSNTIWCITEDNSKNLWIGTNKGISKINLNFKDSVLFTRYTIKVLDEKELNNITALYCDNEEKLWISEWSKGLFILDFKNNTIKQLYSKSEFGNKSLQTIRSIYKDSFNDIWIASYNSGLTLYKNSATDLNLVLKEGLMTVYEDKSGILWIGTFANGVMKYDRRKNRFIHYYVDTSIPITVKGNLVSAILEDREGELWVGTYGMGLNRFNQKREKIKTYQFEPENKSSLSNNKIIVLTESEDGSIWIGTEGGGINRFDKSTEAFQHFEHNPNIKNSITNNEITAIFENSDGEIWIGNTLSNIDRYNPRTSIFKHYYSGDNSDSNSLTGRGIVVFYRGKITGLWIGTLGGGVYNYLPDSDSFRRFFPVPEPNKSINNFTVLSILEDSEGIVWMGTYGGGLIRYDPRNQTFKYYTSKHGLANDVIYGILLSKSGNLWLSTNKGLSKFNPKDETFKNYDVRDGLQSDEFNQGAYFANKKGELFFGGINGFNSFFPEEIKDNNYIPPVYLSKFKVFNEILPLPDPIPLDSEINLLYSQNYFSFEFVALNYTSPEKNQYAYKLEGFDDIWHYVSAQQRYASYTNLDPGEYVLRVKGSNNDGVWNEIGTSVKINITPAFWMTWWFRSLGIFLILFIGFFFYKKRVASLKNEKAFQRKISHRLIEKQEEERTRIAQEMHDVLGQEMLVIKNRALLTLQNENIDSKTNEHINQISDAASKALKTMRQITHNLRPPELDRLGLTETLRTVLMQLRDSTTMKVTGEVENIDKLIPHEFEINLVRIMQEALGNIIKHAEATECEVFIFNKNNKILLNIIDNGKGFESQKNKQHVGLGLAGMRERTKILGGIITIESKIGKGTMIRVEIPLNRIVYEQR